MMRPELTVRHHNRLSPFRFLHFKVILLVFHTHIMNSANLVPQLVSDKQITTYIFATATMSLVDESTPNPAATRIIDTTREAFPAPP